MNEKISQREYASRIGCSEAAVRKAIKSGKIKRGKGTDRATGKVYIIPTVANQEWDKFYDPNYERTTQSGGKMPFAGDKETVKDDKAPPTGNSIADIKRAKAFYDLKQTKLDYERSSGKLIEKTEVYAALFEVAKELREALQSIPDRCIDDIRAADNRSEAHTILYNNITKELERIASVDKMKLTGSYNEAI